MARGEATDCGVRATMSAERGTPFGPVSKSGKFGEDFRRSPGPICAYRSLPLTFIISGNAISNVYALIQ